MTILDLEKTVYYFVIDDNIIWYAYYMGASGAGEHMFSAPIINHFCNHFVYVEPWEVEHRVLEYNDKLKEFMKLFKVLR